MVALLLTACSSTDDFDEADKTEQMVVAHLNFSLPSRIVGKKKAQSTRMGGEVVQADGENGDFRGLDDIHMLCFKEEPTASSNKVGSVIEMNTKSNEVTDEVTEKDKAYSKEIDVPVGTTYFGFYGGAEEEAVPEMTEHERRMHYGIIEAIGVDKRSYQGNSAIRFRPVPICASKDNLGGSSTGQALLNLLNLLMNIPVTGVQAPNDKWATANNLYLYEAYQRMTQLTTLSSQNVQIMLGSVLKIINQEAPDDQGKELVEKITEMIIDNCNPESEPDIVNGVIQLKASYQGFPEDIHLPAGAARIAWDADNNCFEPAEQDYGKGLNVPSLSDYVYPMSLQYQVFSDIVVSDELVINNVNEEGEIVAPENPKYNNWSDLLERGYGADAEKSVQPTTRSVAMVKQVEYAVGSLALRARIKDGPLYDAKGEEVNVDNGFTLKGYIVGGQREVDYNFQPIADSHVYAIYDTDLDPAITQVTRDWPKKTVETNETNEIKDIFDYILGLSTMTDKNIYLAMELVNNGNEFWGAEGVIAHGATFYLVANLELPENIYVDDVPRQIFSKDHATQVNLTITNDGLATATYGLPNLEIPHPVVGVSVVLNWSEGLWFDDVEL